MVITKKQIAAHIDALQDEKAGYQARLDGGDQSMKARIADVDKSIAHFKKTKGEDDDDEVNEDEN